MRFFDIVKTAQGNLWRSKLRSILTILAIFIGAFTLSLTNGIGNGASAYIEKQLGNVGAPDMLNVSKRPPGGQIPIPGSITEYDPERVSQQGLVLLGEEDRQIVQDIPGIRSVTPVYNIQSDYIQYNGGKKFEVMAVSYIDGINFDLAGGRLINDSDRGAVILSYNHAQALGFTDPTTSLGKKVTIAFSDPTGKMLLKDFTVVGALNNSLIGTTGQIFIDPATVKEVQAFQTALVPQLQGKYILLSTRLDPSLSEEAIEGVKEELSRQGYTGLTVADEIGMVNTVIGTIQAIFNVFGAIALLAASFGIVNTLLMGVYERTREIGLMKALGMSRRGIFTLFSIEAMSLGFWGALLGILASVGVGAIANRYASETFLKDLAGFDLLVFPLGSLLGIFLLIVGIAFAAGVLPSLKASKLDPIDALRYE